MALSPFSGMIPTATEEDEEIVAQAEAGGPTLPPLPPIRQTPARELEREIIHAAQGRMGRSHQQERHESISLTNQLNAQSLQIKDFYEMPGVAHNYMDPRNPKSAEDLWKQAEAQAERRDTVFAARQEMMQAVARNERAGSPDIKPDLDASNATRLQAEFEDAAQEVIILQNAQQLNDSLHQEKGRGWTPQIEAAMKVANTNASIAEQKWLHAAHLVQSRPAHEQRQEAYKDLQQFAKDQGADRAADFLDKYRDFKQAQFDLKSAYASGNTDRIEQARERFQETRQAGIEAKGTLQVSEIAKLGAAYRMRMEQPRLFTQTAEKTVEQKTQWRAERKAAQELESQKVMAGTGIEAMRERGQRLMDAGFKDHEAFRNAAMRSNTLTQNALALKTAGMDSQKIVDLALKPSQMDRAADLVKAGFKDHDRIERLSASEKLTDRALQVKAHGSEESAEKIAKDDASFRQFSKLNAALERIPPKASATDTLRASTAQARQEKGLSSTAEEKGSSTDALRASTAKAREEAAAPKEKSKDEALEV